MGAVKIGMMADITVPVIRVDIFLNVPAEINFCRFNFFNSFSRIIQDISMLYFLTAYACIAYRLYNGYGWFYGI